MFSFKIIPSWSLDITGKLMLQNWTTRTACKCIWRPGLFNWTVPKKVDKTYLLKVQELQTIQLIPFAFFAFYKTKLFQLSACDFPLNTKLVCLGYCQYSDKLNKLTSGRCTIYISREFKLLSMIKKLCLILQPPDTRLLQLTSSWHSSLSF